MRPDRQWMYKRLKDGLLNPEFMTGMRQFIEFACSHPEMMDNDRIRCPCNHRKCQNRMFHEVNTVKLHLYRNGFVPDYYYWTLHGEQAVGVNLNYNVNYMDEGFATIDHAESSNRYHSMVMDAAGHALNPTYIEETPNPEAQKFYDMLRAADEDLYPGCRSHSQLSFVAQLMHMKSEHHMSEHNFDDMVRLMKEITPEGSLVPENFYRTKQLVEGMGLPVEKIDCCKNGCMIYWGENRMLITCKFCGHPRYKRQRRGSKTVIPDKKMYYFPLTPRLQRLFASNATASKMRWHAEHEIEDGVMCHPSDSPAWQHFNDNHPEFASETRNVRLDLSTDGYH